MSPQPQLFYEDIFDVTRAAVQAAGGAKQVARTLWPHKPLAEAQRELLDCLNRERPAKLCLEEFLAVLRMARGAGFHQAKHWIDESTGYQPTPPSDPAVERDRLADALEHASANFEKLTHQAKQLLEREPRLKVASR